MLFDAKCASVLTVSTQSKSIMTHNKNRLKRKDSPEAGTATTTIPDKHTLDIGAYGYADITLALMKKANLAIGNR